MGFLTGSKDLSKEIGICGTVLVKLGFSLDTESTSVCVSYLDQISQFINK